MGWVVCIRTRSREGGVNDLETESASVLLPLAVLSVLQREEPSEGTQASLSG